MHFREQQIQDISLNSNMSNEYRGKEIVSELITNPPGVKGAGKIKQSQKVDVKCSECGGIKSTDYRGHVTNRSKSKSDRYLCHSCANGPRLALYNKSWKGKPLEDRLGEVKANTTKEKLREYAVNNNTGDRLPNYTGVSWEERFGLIRANELKQQFRDNSSVKPMFGPDNPQWGKPAHKLSGKGTKGYYNGIYFRSLMEASFIINFLEKNKMAFENGELRKFSIPYILNGSPRNYFCDFVAEDTFYEIKPKALHNTAQNRAKWDSARLWCSQNGYKFEVYSEDDFDRLSQDEVDKLVESGKIKLL